MRAESGCQNIQWNRVASMPDYTSKKHFIYHTGRETEGKVREEETGILTEKEHVFTPLHFRFIFGLAPYTGQERS